MAPNITWSFESEVCLRRMWAQGCSATEIAAALGMTRNAVLGKRWRLDLPFFEGKGAKTARAQRARPPRVQRRKPKPKPQPVLVEKGEAPAMRWLGLQELEQAHCHWPLEGSGPPFVFCGADVKAASPYCAHHAKLARNKKFCPENSVSGGRLRW